MERNLASQSLERKLKEVIVDFAEPESSMLDTDAPKCCKLDSLEFEMEPLEWVHQIETWYARDQRNQIVEKTGVGEEKTNPSDWLEQLECCDVNLELKLEPQRIEKQKMRERWH
jgi:hypothetical protein